MPEATKPGARQPETPKADELIVEFQGVTKTYDAQRRPTTAIRDITFKVANTSRAAASSSLFWAPPVAASPPFCA